VTATRADGHWWTEYADMLPPRFTTYLELEDRAARIRTWEPQLVPGLLQTPGYAHAVMAAGDDPDATVARGLEIRRARQQILARPGADVHAVVDEAALQRPADQRARAAQLRALLDLPRQVTLQVLPWSAGLVAQGRPAFTVLRLPGTTQPVAFTETLGDAHLVYDPVRAGQYVAQFDRLADAALDRAASADLIRGMLTKGDRR
jgi:Domain of unknown function (DUF5753)